jgi:hypothetical protein
VPFPRLERCIFDFLALFVLSVPGSSTTVVVIRTSEHIVVAADSLWFASSDWQNYRPFLACKLMQVGHIYFAVSAVDTDAFEVRAIARKAIAASASVNQAAESFLHNADQMARRTAAHEDQSTIEMCRKKICVEAVFFGIEQGIPVFTKVALQQVGGSRASLKFIPHKDRCPGNCDRQKKKLWIVGQRDQALRRQRENPEFMTRNSDEEIARQLVEFEKAAVPHYVGGPIDVLTLDVNGAHWAPSQGGMCSSDQTMPMGRRY